MKSEFIGATNIIATSFEYDEYENIVRYKVIFDYDNKNWEIGISCNCSCDGKTIYCKLGD